jgi:MOSC domain-containing protein YiiM
VTCRVAAIHVARASGLPMEPRQRVEVVTDHGLEGDRKARRGSRGQVTLVSADELEEVAGELGLPIAPGATRRNVTVSGLVPPRRPGARLRLGPLVLEVTGPAEPCRLMDELIGPGAARALRGRAGVRSRVLVGGALAVGDAVAVEAPA